MTYDIRKDRQIILENETLLVAGKHEVSPHFETPSDGTATALLPTNGLPNREASPAIRAEAMRKIDGAVKLVERLFRNPVMHAVKLMAIALAVSEFMAMARQRFSSDPNVYARFQGVLSGVGVGKTTSRILSTVFWGALATLGARVFLKYLYKVAEGAVNRAERSALNSQEQAQVDQLNRELLELQRSMARV